MSTHRKGAMVRRDVGEESLKSLLLGNMRSYGIFFALVLVIIVFDVLTGGRLLNPNNVVALFQQNAYVLVTAIGMLMIIIATQIDLSVGSVVAFIGGVGALCMKNGLGWAPTIIMIAIGLLIGAWNGVWISYNIGVPGFVTTLGGMLMFRGLATVIAGESIPVSDSTFRTISKGYLTTLFIGDWAVSALVVGAVCIVLYVWTQFRKRAKALKNDLPAQPLSFVILKCAVATLAIGYVTYLFSMSGNATQGGIPIVIVIIGTLIGVYYFVLNRTAFGRNVYAIGGNRKAAVLSVINAKKVEFEIFLNMGFLVAVASVIPLSRLASATAQTGMEFEMDAIAACFIGGTAVAGGVGTIPGAMVGALIMGVLNQGLSIMGVDASWVKTIKGLVVILAVAYDLLSKRKKA